MERILDLLEEENTLCEIVEDYTGEEALSIHIGSENKHKDVKECSMVVSAYELNDEIIGGIGLIGPTRMHYSKASTLVDYVAKELTRVLSSGEIL